VSPPPRSTPQYSAERCSAELQISRLNPITYRPLTDRICWWPADLGASVHLDIGIVELAMRERMAHRVSR
jgi:hypothetical protein